jgi:hypothetical protein
LPQDETLRIFRDAVQRGRIAVILRVINGGG